MPTENPFPLEISTKEDSWNKLQVLSNVAPGFKYTAKEWNKVIQALEYLYENLGSGPGENNGIALFAIPPLFTVFTFGLSSVIYIGIDTSGEVAQADDTFQDIDELITEQNNQLENESFFVLDATDDPNVTTGAAIYKLIVDPATGDLSDYVRTWKAEDEQGNTDSGSSIPVSKTGTRIVFTEDAFYNSENYLTSGNLVFDIENAMFSKSCFIWCDRYVPQLMAKENIYSSQAEMFAAQNSQTLGLVQYVSSLDEYWIYNGTTAGDITDYSEGAKLLVSGKTMSTDALNILKTFYNGTNVDVRIDTKQYVPTPTPTIVPDVTQNTVQAFQNIGTRYVISFNTVNDENTATLIADYDGVSPVYVHTGLTNGQEYFYFIKAFAVGYLDSDTGVSSGTPNLPSTNTFIGGVGATYSSNTSLANFLGLQPEEIEEFSVDVSNHIVCNITANYTLPADAFLDNTNITYYEDPNGMCNAVTGLDHFRNCPNLDHIEFGANFVGGTPPTCVNNDNLKYYHFPNNTGSVQMRDCPLAEWANVLQATSVSTFGFADAESLRSLYLPSATSLLGTNNFQRIVNQLNIVAPLLTSITGTQALYLSGNVNNKNIFTGVTAFGTSQMCRNFNGALILPSLNTDIGGVPTDSGTFLNIVSTATLYLNTYLQTNNAGGIDGDVAYAIGRGVTVVWITDNTPPSAINNLLAANITVNSVDPTFTVPLSQNPIQHYDVYIDEKVKEGVWTGYRLLDEVSVSGGTISGLKSATEYKVKYVTVDDFYNQSPFSNEITFTTL